MSDFQIISDSSCDINDELVKQYNLDLIPFYVSFDKENYFKEREEISIDEFYRKLEEEKIFPKTSLPSVEDYLNKFKPYVEKDIAILCICLSSEFSGSYQSALNAANILSEENPKAIIRIIDSRQATAGQGVLVLEAAVMKNAGLDLDKIVENINMLKNDLKIQFTIDTLEYLQKGGRIGKASALAGNVLKVKPLIVLKDGELFPHGIIRGRKKALSKVIDMAKDDLGNVNYDDYRFVVLSGKINDEIENFKKTVEEKMNVKITHPCFRVGTTIGTYTGSTAIGICYIKKYETLSR